MSLKEKLDSNLKDAMRANDAERKMVLRDVLSAIQLAEVDAGDLNEEAVLAIVQKEAKNRRESIADAEKAERADLVAAAESEIKILEEFLPEGLSDEELEAIVTEAIATTGAESMADMGKLMGAIMPKVKGKADGNQVNALVRKHLQGS